MAVEVSGLDFQGRGIARDNGQVVFIRGALPGESVTYRTKAKKKRFVEAEVDDILVPSPQRIQPACPHYDKCGGCALQHLSFSAQVEAKQALWLEQLQRIGRVEPDEVIEPIEGVPWHYRARTRLAVSYQGKVVHLGFFARNSHQVINVDDCLVLDEKLSAVLPSLRLLLQDLLPQRVDTVSLHRGDNQCALALESTSALAMDKLTQWQQQHGNDWSVWLNGNYIAGCKQHLFYSLPDFSVNIEFSPDDFTQVNPLVNRELVNTAITWALADSPQAAMDFFAGLGNFSLPLARRGVDVSAVEGVKEMVQRMSTIAAQNNLDDAVAPSMADLFAPTKKQMREWVKKDIWILDPPRAGAAQLLRAMPKKAVKKMVYISCDPATLARDAAILADKGYRLVHGRIANMFAQTAHVESVSLFALS